MKLKVLWIAGLMLAATAGQVQAGFIIGMEGIAPSGSFTSEDNASRTFGDFRVFVRHGHYWDSAGPDVGTFRPSNGTDYLLNDDTGGIDISKLSGGTFSVQSFDASEYDISFSRPRNFQAVGFISGGGTVTQPFTTNTTFGFQTFTLLPAFTNLTLFRLIDSNGSMAWDNIATDQAAAVPEPSSIAMLGVGALGLVFARRKRRQMKLAA